MECGILKGSLETDQKRWLALYEKLPEDRQDVYFLPEYLLPYEKDDRGEALCAFAVSGDAVWLYPFLKSSIHGTEHFDILSAYGYAGPLVNGEGEDSSFLKKAWQGFSDWCLKENVVTEFVRFHPLLENTRWAPSEMQLFVDRQTVPILLHAYPEAVWNTSYYRVHRQMLRKAERYGYTFHVLEARKSLSWFVPLYNETQDFLSGSSATRFSSAYFESLTQGLTNNAWIGAVQYSDKIVAAVLVLEGKRFAHSHLMGYCRTGITAGMTNLVYHGIALEVAERKKTCLHMGGGRTKNEDDSLFAFKKSLSPERATFSLGTRCHSPTVYEQLGKKWESLHGPRPAGYFQFYRLRGIY
ncbi:MAG: GNAT family N-acetyltransferase [Candidatus Omnitrophica bacterium]|nr:GNAT family N-acetyltransferase [Candidatus Omnitrophota bacterium]